MNINRKHQAIKKAVEDATLAINNYVPGESILPLFNYVTHMRLASNHIIRINAIRAKPTDPFDVLDMTQCGSLKPVVTVASGGKTIKIEGAPTNE